MPRFSRADLHARLVLVAATVTPPPSHEWKVIYIAVGGVALAIFAVLFGVWFVRYATVEVEYEDHEAN